MRMHLIYPKWPKLERQTEFHLPPHGPVVFAAEVPEDVEITFTDENLEPLDFDASTNLAALSVMLTCQLPRALAIADRYRELGVPVIMGGIGTMLHAEEAARHADSLFLGEVEGRFAAVIQDLKENRLRPVYDYLGAPPDISLAGTARRGILKRDLYNYRGVQMVDLLHASRGCKFNCMPCCVAYLGGKSFRPRPIHKVIAEMESIANNRLFFVDNSLAQDREWLKDLFTAMIPLKRKWISHPIMYDPEILDLAAQAGCWYVYQAVIDDSKTIRERIRMLKDHDIGIEGTILLGLDDHDESYIKRMVDFLLEVELDMAEFTILTPFPHTPIREMFEQQDRILSNNWLEYTCDKVVFQPKQMPPDTLQELFHYAWDTFYAEGGPQLRMGNLFKKVISKEMDDGTYRRYDLKRKRAFPKKNPDTEHSRHD
ncbi:B12-binding domain-containing radical SAM protein [Desulfonatronum lacustre]|uniref:B12-binding domain-containing radical SAM protein n=1 Tax=Desulfonatronum lacustre TaxID=66849 RepID=UPI00048C1271|nr:radical SAM protein [Desulfonatronum lacustre]